MKKIRKVVALTIPPTVYGEQNGETSGLNYVSIGN